MKKSLPFALLALAAALPARAADSAVLRNGFSIQHQHRQTLGPVTRLYIDGDQSFVDIPNSEIDHFESSPQPLNPLPPESVAPTPAPPFDLSQAVAAASSAYQLDPDLVRSVIRAESGFNIRAVSPKGAQGLMQLMPKTANQLGVPNPFDPQSNVEAGTRYLRQLLERYHFDLVKALAAYNAGPQRIDHYRGVPPYYETRVYVSRVVRDFNKKKLASKSSPLPTPKPSSTHSPSSKALSTAASSPSPAPPANPKN